MYVRAFVILVFCTYIRWLCGTRLNFCQFGIKLFRKHFSEHDYNLLPSIQIKIKCISSFFF